MLTSDLIAKMSDKWKIEKSDLKNFVLLVSKKTGYKLYIPNTPLQPSEFASHILEYVINK